MTHDVKEAAVRTLVWRRLFLALSGVWAILLCGPRLCAAQTQTCQFTISLPGTQNSGYTISGPGIYCLVTDVTMDANFTSAAFEIKGSDVVLDLNGHKVSGKSAGAASLAIGMLRVEKASGTSPSRTELFRDSMRAST
jgi:hypothetical protein